MNGKSQAQKNYRLPNDNTNGNNFFPTYKLHNFCE